MGSKSGSHDWNWFIAECTSKFNKFQENMKDFQWWNFPGNVLSIPEDGNLTCAVFWKFIQRLQWVAQTLQGDHVACVSSHPSQSAGYAYLD